MIVIAKIGTSSLTDDDGTVQQRAIDKLSAEVAVVRGAGHQVILVSSGAIGAGLPVLGWTDARPRDARTLQAASAVGQHRLMTMWDAGLARHGFVAGQILMAPRDFFDRSQYLHAKGTLERLLELGVVPVVNENDAVADDAIRFGDNDRIAALIAHLVRAERLVLLTDTDGLFTADPRTDPAAVRITEFGSTDAVDAHISGAGTKRGSGGMASKVAAARMAAWSGVTTVIAAATRENVLVDALVDEPGFGTVVRPEPHPLSAKKLWIAFALEPAGTISVDAGAHRALLGDGRSLLAVGVTSQAGEWERGDAVDIVAPDGAAFARGLASVSASELEDIQGTRNADQPDSVPGHVVHRDDLVLLG